MRRWLDRALLGSGWLAVLAGFAGVVLHLGTWRWEWFVLGASGASYLMTGAVVGLILVLIARGWRSAGVAGVVVAAALWTQLPIFVADGHAATGPRVTVMQSNILFGGADVGAVLRAVRDERVDLLTVDELTPEAVERFRSAGIDAELPHQFLLPGSGGGGTGIYSRYPLRDTERLDGFLINNLGATMAHPERGDIAVFALHPIPPNLDFAAWSRELPRIREILDAQTGPAIVGADFNATRDHAAFRDLVRGRFDSAADLVGAGPMPTWPDSKRWGPVLGIDHILVAGGTAEELRSLTIPGSDHRALVARLRLDPAEN
ncbi:endonuclease/exonuclease/phosphatase family protein [Nocardia sp. NPDC048505]|uniref:endonuclease/exonuclease/phosphatase family protein n=1 Tax=unclassified Nocardia TaxID=2637762 RepID=UPI0033E03644